MISLTKLGHQEFVLNAELIQTIESTPDTVVTLSSGVKFMVEQPVNEVVRRVIEYQRSIHGMAAGG